MARSAHSYVRGTTVKFYEWLEGAGGRALPAGPDVWICGDCHLGNLGPVASAEGDIDIQIRDLDQTVIGSPAHDLVRLGLSLAMAARGSDLPGITTASMLQEMVQGYGEGLTAPPAGQPRPSGSRAIEAVLQESFRRRWRHLATDRIGDVELHIPIGKNFWSISAQERGALVQLFTNQQITSLLTSWHGKKSDGKVRIMDAAYWVKGCSSLGRLRYAVLLKIGKRELCLMDVKEASTAAAPRAARAQMPRRQAIRVVEGARNLSPYLGDRMIAAELLGRQVVIRELMPQDLKLEMGRITSADAIASARYLAAVVGRAHGRQMEAQKRKDWKQQVQSRTTGGLHAPSWLWKSVLELISSHEAAYLEHCRTYLMA